MKLVVTGAGGLLGSHVAARLHARNCARRFQGEPDLFEVEAMSREQFSDPEQLVSAIAGARAVLHFAGVNRGADDEVEAGNPTIAELLAKACLRAAVRPHILYANSTHAASDTPYGRSKRRAGEILEACAGQYTNLVLPHIFGEGARPDYNNVTATFIARVVAGQLPDVNPRGQVALLHAGAAAEIAIDAAVQGRTGVIEPKGRTMSVEELLARIVEFHGSYSANLFPDLSNPFDRALFNTYRAVLFPHEYPRELKLHTDPRGTLFEASRGGGGGQTFLSWTHPGITRGNHFHLDKVERFLVLEGEALIRIRHVLDETVREFPVTGTTPTPIDMPTLHTHSIENVGNRPLLTLFWTHEVFDPSAPDTYADPVLAA